MNVDIVKLDRAVLGLQKINGRSNKRPVLTCPIESDRRLRAFALYGAGFVLGPVIGGALGDVSVRDPFLAAAVLNGVNLLFALLMLPESHQPARTPIDWRALNPFVPLRWAITFRALVPLLTVFLLIGLVGQTYSTVWVLFVEDRFGWTGTEVGLSLGTFGALVALAQGFAVGPATQRLGERGTLLLGIVCEAAALLVLAFARAGWVAFAVIPLLAFGGIGLPALRALQTKAVDRESQGQLQGVIASLVSLAAIFGPLIFSWVYAYSRPGWNGLTWIIGVAIYAVAVPVVLTVARPSLSQRSIRPQ